MDCENNSDFEPDDIRNAPESNFSSSLSDQSFINLKHSSNSSSTYAPSLKKSKRSAEKRVVTIPLNDSDRYRGKGGIGDGAPPPDSWSWRKYGQKPIKGSPYPRSYYRCSGSKGCPARKQVERSHTDPSKIVISYSFNHNHSLPLPKNHHNRMNDNCILDEPIKKSPPKSPQLPVRPIEPSPSSGHDEDKFSDHIIGEENSCNFQWLLYGESTSSLASLHSRIGSDEHLYGSILGPAGAGEDEEDELFSGLGELPEFSVVLRQGMASASWVGPR